MAIYFWLHRVALETKCFEAALLFSSWSYISKKHSDPSAMLQREALPAAPYIDFLVYLQICFLLYTHACFFTLSLFNISLTVFSYPTPLSWFFPDLDSVCYYINFLFLDFHSITLPSPCHTHPSQRLPSGKLQSGMCSVANQRDDWSQLRSNWLY